MLTPCVNEYQAKLTLNPETQDGQELLCLSREVLKIKSIEHANN